jgi:hypothetical protein
VLTAPLDNLYITNRPRPVINDSQSRKPDRLVPGSPIRPAGTGPATTT